MGDEGYIIRSHPKLLLSNLNKGKMGKKKFIYLIQELDETMSPTGYYKVGSTGGRKRRMRKLQRANPRCLLMIHCTKSKVDASRVEAVHDYMHATGGIQPATEEGGAEWYITQGDSDFMKRSFEKGLGEVLTGGVYITKNYSMAS